jgi:penicillin amidase
MRTRASFVAIATLVAGIAACSGGTETPSSLAITPGNPGTLHGPQLFTAVVANDDASVTWALTSGMGSLSSTSGRMTTYSPPGEGASGNITITATTSDGLTASVTATIAPSNLPAGTIPSLSAKVEISYDAQDIPHLACATENDCLEAQGYLQARDRLFQMDLFRRTARGQLSTMIGALTSGGQGLELSSDQQFLTFFTTRDGRKIEDELVEHLDADTASKIGAFVNGINAYITELKNNPGEAMPGEYAQLPYPLKASDIPAWTAQDTLAIGRLQQFQLSETISEESGYGTFAAVFAPGAPLANPGLFNAYIRSQDTERSYTLPPATTQRGLAPAQLSPVDGARLSGFADAIADARKNIKEARGLLGEMGIDTGSNNWVVDAAHSATGQAMVANDPHLSLQYPPLFHLIAMTASDASGLDMQGGSFPGIPGALIGRGKHVGWGVTVVGYDVTDLYTETVVPCMGSTGQVPCVNFTPGNQFGQVPITVVPVTINVRQPSGALASVSYAIYVNKNHGPYISYNPNTGKAISMRWTGHEITSDLRAFLHLNVATSIGGVADANTSGSTTAFAALHDMATGAQNFVLADDTGKIGYDPHALVPKRNWAGLNGRYPWFPLPGDGSAEWGSGNAADNCAGTPSSGTLPSANCWYADVDLPHSDASNNVASGTGFLVTANADPGGYGDSNVPVSVRNGAPFYLSFDWDEPTGFRHKQITSLLAAATAGGRKVSVTDMENIQSNHTSILASAFIPTIEFLVAQIPAGHAPPEVTAATAMLDAWSKSTNALDCPTGLTGTSPSSAVSTDATVQANSAACMLFHTFIRILINNVFNDEFKVLGKATGRTGLTPDSGAAIRGMLYMLQTQNLTNNTDQAFCNNMTAPGVSTTVSCPTQVITALATAYDELAGFKGPTSNWVWGRVHTLTTTSPASPIVDGTFGAGSFARPGGLLTVDVGNPSFSSADPLAFSYGSGSNLRFVTEMNPAAANTKMQLPGPERDAPHGVFANTPDLIGQYVQNQYFDFAYSAQGSASAVSTQTLSPTAAQ